MGKRKWTAEEVAQYRSEHGVLFYYNREDANIFVPKAIGLGFSPNWANPVAWLLVLAVVAFIVLISVLRRM